jgi:hypothetical protein
MVNLNFCPDTFNSLSLSSKSSYLWDHGDLVFMRNQQGYIIRLYSLLGHWVEVYLRSSNLQVEKIVMLESSYKLQFYEKFIELPATAVI